MLKNILTLLAKSVLIPSGLTAAASAKNTDCQKKIHESRMTSLIISNEETKNLVKNQVY